MAKDVVVKVFDSTVECPKCGLGDTFSSNADDGPKIDMYYCEKGVSGKTCEGLPFEHLHLTCGQCKYSFLMKTKEESEEKEKSQRGGVNYTTSYPGLQQSPGRGRRGRILEE